VDSSTKPVCSSFASGKPVSSCGVASAVHRDTRPSVMVSRKSLYVTTPNLDPLGRLAFPGFPLSTSARLLPDAGHLDVFTPTWHSPCSELAGFQSPGLMRLRSSGTLPPRLGFVTSLKEALRDASSLLSEAHVFILQRTGLNVKISL